jgi:hypothetical protein
MGGVQTMKQAAICNRQRIEDITRKSILGQNRLQKTQPQATICGLYKSNKIRKKTI